MDLCRLFDDESREPEPVCLEYLVAICGKVLDGSRRVLKGGTHHVIVVVGAPEVRTVASAEVGFITFGLVDPFPVEVTSEVDVE